MQQDQVIKPEDVDVEGESPSKEKKPKKHKIKKEDARHILTDVLQHKPLSQQWKPFPRKFHVLKEKSGGHQYLEELENQVLSPVHKDVVVDALIKYFRRDCFHIHGTDITSKDLIEVVRMWAGDTDSFAHHIEPVRSLSAPGYTWHRLPFDIKSGSHPTWNELLHRMTNNEAFQIWLGSLFDGKSDRSQYCWLFGDGRNSKGMIVLFLERLFGPALAQEQITRKENQFWTSGLVGKRVVVFDDHTDTKFPTEGMFKRLTGGAGVRVELKSSSIFKANLSCKFLFTSNERPEISSNEADLRRAIFCEMGAITGQSRPDYLEDLWREAPAFLHTCWEAYRAKCPKKGEIPVDREQLAVLASHTEERFETLWERNFVADSAGKVTPSKLQDILRSAGFWDFKESAKFKSWLKRVHGVDKKRPGGKEWFYVGMREKHVQQPQKF